MAEYIEREALLARVKEKSDLFDKKIEPFSAGLYKYLAGEVEAMPAADVVEVKRGEWVLEAHKENSNYGWNVTAECPECRAEKKVVWRGLFPNFCDALAKEVALDNAKYVKLSNFCPNCGADMREEENK